jgi:hypothetical protein
MDTASSLLRNYDGPIFIVLFFAHFFNPFLIGTNWMAGNQHIFSIKFDLQLFAGFHILQFQLTIWFKKVKADEEADGLLGGQKIL